MFTAALFTIAKTLKQSKCPLIDKWITTMSHTHTHTHTHTQPFAATIWMDLEGIMLHEISQTEKKTNTQ